MNWFTDAEKKVVSKVSSLWSNEDAALLAFMTPLLQQIKATALQLGKDNLQAGIGVLQNAAVTAAVAAATAPPGTNKVTAAEAAFLQAVASQGITVIHNAEAAAIKAAVAMIQTQTPITITTSFPLTPTAPVSNT